jgi:hypothetical protein
LSYQPFKWDVRRKLRKFYYTNIYKPHIFSLLRRPQGLTASDELIIDNIIINPVQQLLTIGGEAITIGSTEFVLKYGHQQCVHL